MKKLIVNRETTLSILAALLLVCGVQGVSHGQTLSASSTWSLTEETLDGSVVMLTLGGATYERRLRKEHANAFKVSGIAGVTLKSTFDSFNPLFDVQRVSNAAVTVKLDFAGNIDTDATLTFTVGADAVANYNGPALTAEILVREGDPFNIQGPWLWMVVPTDLTAGNVISAEGDSLATASGEAITEAHVAQNGVDAGDTIGHRQWSHSDIQSVRQCHKYNIRLCPDPTVCWANNINPIVNALGMGTGTNTKAHTAYALINLISPREQRDVNLSVKSGDAIKVWLNGNVVHREAADSLDCRQINVPGACDPRVCTSDPSLGESRSSSTRATLKAGNNLLLIKVQQHGEYWDMEVQLDADFTTATPTTSTTMNLPPTTTQEIPITNTTLSIWPSPVQSPAIGKQLPLALHIANGEAVAGYQATVQFDTTALRYVSSANGDYLPEGGFFARPVVDGNRVTLAGASLGGESSGAGTLATLTFEVIAVKASTLTLSDALLTNSTGVSSLPQVEAGQITEAPQLSGDVNKDGTVNIQDMVLVASNIGQIGQNAADVNRDGVVNIVDLVLVAGALNTPAAPSLHFHSLEMLTAADVRRWLSQAQLLNLTDATSQQGILFLENLLMVLSPKETILLANYPNPFNPETWIPYRLANDSDVLLAIYDINGVLVRELDLGHQRAGYYTDRSRAAYWDGRNEWGEQVASGVYFYQLRAGDYLKLRKMVILK